MMDIDFQKLKNLYDEDDGFQIDEIISDSGISPYTEIIMLRDGTLDDEDYYVTVECHVEYEDDYETIGTFECDQDGFRSAVQCYIENGGTERNIKIFA